MDETRVIDFISMAIVPTQDDFDQLNSEMEILAEKFSSAENNLAFMTVHSSVQAGNDSIEFSAGTSELTLPKNQFQPSGTYPMVADEAIQEAVIGDVIGPFATVETTDGENIMFVAKVTDVRKENQSWVRHILVNIDATRTEEEAKLKAEGIIADIEANDNFVENVTNNSDDPGSLAANGEYKWFPEGRMVPEFNDASFNGEIGKLQLVKTQFGFHIVEVLGRGERNVPKLAIVTKKVKPSENTMKYAEEQVYDYIYEINESKKDSAFYTMAIDSNHLVMNSRIWISQTYVTGVTNYEKVMRFAFNRNALEGDISDPMLDGDKYIVAYLSNVIEEGEPEFEDVKEQMRFSALKDKQAKVYIELLSNKNSLAEVAGLITKGNILNAQLTFGATVIAGGGGNEPEVIGSVFREEFKVGAMSVPLKGRTGVYVIMLDGITEAPEAADFATELDFTQTARRGSADNLVIRSLREKADVKDNRRKREYQ
jgi:peptidyl-prolyl cis-trans isomerase D